MAIQSLDDIKKLPLMHKAAAVCVLYALIGYFFWFLIFQAAWEDKAGLEATIEGLRSKISSQEAVVARKARHMQEVAGLKEQFRLALLKLPEQKDIPRLLRSIALEGRRSGLDFVLFEPIPPPPPVAKEKTPPAPKKGEEGAVEPDKEQFYETISIKMTVRGRFHDTVSFFDRIARLPRIINLDAITVGERASGTGVSPVNRGQDGRATRKDLLTSAAVIKTYMFKGVKSKDGVDKSEGKGK